MAERIRKSAANSSHAEEIAPETTAESAQSDLVAELDDLLDEIDEVLETNAEEFVKNYVQKGGQ
jgi:ubiquitin-like protein Pup